MTPDPNWNYNPGKAGQRFLNKIEADKLNSVPPAQAREAIKGKLNSPEFEAAFQSGEVRDLAVAVLPDDVAQALRDRGLKLPGQIVADGIPAGKLARKHRNVSVEQYQTLQRALDQGGVYLQASGKGEREKARSLLAEYQDDKGQWWFYAINLKNLRIRTIFDTNAQYRVRKFNQENVETIREWDPSRWREK